MNSIGKELEKQYYNLFEKYQLEQPLNSQNIISIIRQSLHNFLLDAEKPAIYCNGGHTKMLMADFVYELKKVKYIVDNYAQVKENKGFVLIRDDDIEVYGIDKIILSSYKFRKDLKKILKEKHSDIPVLDIYDEFEKKGINVQADYYYSNHPYQHYKMINQLQREIRESNDIVIVKKLYVSLVTKYLHIKDFRTALIKLGEYEKYDIKARQMLQDVKELYDLQKKAVASISEHNVLMFCMDGLRQQDLSEQTMPKLSRLIQKTCYCYTNAYSFSTSTFESLVPVYSENGDLRSRYYEKNNVNIESCRFATLAEKQRRAIYIYGDAEHYVEGKHINYSEQFLTVTEKLWQFILDACETENGMFYLHELYESHFTFSNPYTEIPLISEGTAMLFDFLPAKGGHLRADYKKQHEDSIRYLDDVIEPLLSPMQCRMLIYADHGNLLLDYNTKLSEIDDMEYTCSEGWTRIPLIMRSPEVGIGTDNRLASLMQLNNMMISLLQCTTYILPDSEHIKMARSELYNPDFRFLYEMIGKRDSLQAFECFLFTDGNKFIIFADGTTKVYDIYDRPNELADKRMLFERIQGEITVCDISQVQV